ncbi:MAG: response regulator transcription factor [Dehalococcoidales bacterium]|nr:response regulator transcription factor [Dehalococcoidales bacterium]
MKPNSILIIEDNPDIVETISIAIEMRWTDVKIVSSARGDQGLEMTETESPDIVILDLGLPDISGFEVLKGIRLFSDVPVLILTARADEADIVKGLEWGADDYMVKPFKQLELLARIQGIVRRHKPLIKDALSCGQLCLQLSPPRVTLGSKEIKVSRTEALILEQLMRNPGNVVSYENISRAMWGDDFPEAAQSIKVHIRHLREKLEPDPGHPEMIITSPGAGYSLARPS